MRIIGNKKGQNAIEYLLVFAVVMVVLFSFLSPKEGGLFRSQLDSALDLSMEGVECIAASVCYNKEGCNPCGDNCCQEGEEHSCPQDCISGPGADSGIHCIRDPSLGFCDIGDCHEGCEVVTVPEQAGHCEWEEHGQWHCSPPTQSYSTCVEIPCAGATESECVSQSHCIWR